MTNSDEAEAAKQTSTAGAAASFDHVVGREKRFVASRRRAAGFRGNDDFQPASVGGSPDGRDQADRATVGLALSGGGIRSASISLGMIQVLRKYGLFRYIDYMSVISGGSYTGALIASSFYRATGNAVANHKHGGDRLDVDLVGSTIQPTRVRALMNDGRYLIRPLEWVNRFLSGWFSLLLVIGSALLATSALIAFLWRSMDFYVVRDYLNELGIGSDMWSALLPLLVLIGLWAVCWTISYFRDGASARGRWAKRVMVLLILCAIATIAGLIGNGDIELSDGVQSTASYLKIPLILSVFGGLIPTLFRKQLYRSGLVESSFVEKLIYRYTAVAVVLGIPMLMIGYFAKEDVSNFSAQRDGRLLWGDVRDFPAFEHWFKQLVSPDDLDSTAPTSNGSLAAIPDCKSYVTDPQRLVIDNLLDDIQLLLAVQSVTQPRVQGRDQSLVNQPEVVVLRVEEHKGKDGTKVFGNSGELKLAGGRLVPMSAQDQETEQAISDAKSSDDQVTINQWARWKFKSIVQRSSVLLGHVFAGDSDDPLGLAVNINQQIIDREKDILRLFNDRIMTNRGFGPQLLVGRFKVADVKWGELPWSSVPEGVRADMSSMVANDRVALSKIPPDEVIEVNRAALEIAHPDLIRSRNDIRRTVVIHSDQLHRLLMFLMFAGVFVVSALVINPNTTSIQRYYQERLAGAYLGGSDEAHNMRLTDLAPRMGPGPLLVIGGAANYRFRPANKDRHPDLDTPDQPLESTDRVGHFEFSPLFCGSKDLGYAPTDEYCNGSLRLADAVAISGAALNPLYFERWEMLVIVGMFNLRLGQWMPNPGGGAITLKPTFAALLHDIVNVKERRITGVTERRHILLTDGGHFDNTGLQSLLERRCRVILLSDSSQDGDFHFDNLATVIGRVKGQLGITFHEIDGSQELDLRRHSTEFKNGEAHFFCCEIKYPAKELENRTGLLIYFKSSLTGDEPPFVWNHAVKNATFPHDSSVNQSFSPAQFCAYLGLGQHLVESTVAGHRNSVDELGRSPDFKLRDFAAVFLSRLNETQRDRFLDRLLAKQELDFSEFEHAARGFNESIRAGKWAELPKAMSELKRVLSNRTNSLSSGLVLDMLADAIVGLDDFSHPEAAKTLEDAAQQFNNVLATACEMTDESELAKKMACEIRTRFQRPGQYRSVRPVLREAVAGYTDELIEHLISDGDISQDGFVFEVMCELGERLVRTDFVSSPKLTKLLQKKTFSSDKDIRECACRLLAAMREKEEPHDSRQQQIKPGKDGALDDSDSV